MNSPHVRLSKDIFPLSQKMNNSIEKIIKLKNKKDSSILDQEQPDIEHPKGKIMGKIKSVFSSNTDEELRKDIEKLRSDFYKLLNDNKSNEKEKETLVSPSISSRLTVDFYLSLFNRLVSSCKCRRMN